ncbi:MAG: ABC transporter permease [Oscillospiraceae bacterium]|nr:ABC transporter permease [Oscillospiraceae bacterium]
MSILTHFTLRCLKQNRVRTLVTIVGIILSVALFTAVAEGAYSGWRFLLDFTSASQGSYHGLYYECSDAELAELRAQDGVHEVASLDGVGWALVGTSPYQPYLRISSMSENLTDLLPIRLVEGRMPQNDHELLISNRAAEGIGADLAVGQQLTLRVGQRESTDGVALQEEDAYLEDGEHLRDTVEEIWTIVGVYNRLSNDVESFDMPGSLALTVGGTGAAHTALFTLDQVEDTLDFLARHRYGSGSIDNDALLYMYGVSENKIIVHLFYSLVAILFALIFFGSVELILNSFSISVSERTKQFGLLKSIGATNRQIRRTVLTEALLLCMIAIPLGLLLGCGGIGLTLRLLRPTFDKLLSVDSSNLNVSLRLVLHLPSLALAAGIGLFTALFSAWLPAKRATRLSPMVAIRQSTDIKIRAKEVEVSRLTGWLFGFPGTLAAKNFKRSRKQYRSTIISLFFSIVLFVSAFSFSDNLKTNVGENLNKYVPDVIVTREFEDFSFDPAQLPSLAEKIRQTEHTQAAAWAVRTRLEIPCPESIMSKEALASQLYHEDGNYSISGAVFLLPEEEYRALCREAGMDPGTRQAIAYGCERLVIPQGDNNYSYQICPLFRSDALPLQLDAGFVIAPKNMVFGGTGYDEKTGNEVYDFIPVEAIGADGSMRGEDFISIPKAGITLQKTLQVGAFLEEQPLFSGGQELTIYLPISGSEDILNTMFSEVSFFLQAPSHAAAKAEVKTLLNQQEDNYFVYDTREDEEIYQAVFLVLNVFSFGFIVLISLIAAANVFNTISTNIGLRRREFATLRSVGMGNRAFRRMMRFECLLYGSKALLWGLPVSISISWLIWKAVNSAFVSSFRLPWTAIGIAAVSVFLVVFATMLYATGKIKKDNPIDALKQD